MHQQISGLAVELAAERRQGGKPDGARLAGFQDRKVGDGHADPVGEFRERHPAFEQDAVEADADRHAWRSLDRQFGFAAQTGALAKHFGQHKDHQHREPGREAQLRLYALEM
eukprot:gene21401-41444_t